jgi:hypothetical protein
MVLGISHVYKGCLSSEVTHVFEVSNGNPLRAAIPFIKSHCLHPSALDIGCCTYPWHIADRTESLNLPNKGT